MSRANQAEHMHQPRYGQRLLHKNIDALDDQEIIGLVDEMHRLRHEPKIGQVIHFLRQSLLSSAKWTPFEKKEFRSPDYLLNGKRLTQKVGALISSPIYNLCRELLELPSKIQGDPIEDHHSDTLYNFLNRTLRERKVVKTKRR
jgi:hypothetical protein